MQTFRYASATRFAVSWDGEQVEIGTIDELMVALDVLNRRHDRELLEQLASALRELIAAGDRARAANLKILLKGLSRDDRLFVIDALGSSLLGLVGNAVDLRNLLVSLANLDVEAAILRALGESGLRQLISSSQQLWEILEWSYGQSGMLLLALLGPTHLRRLVAHGGDLAEIVRRLDPNQQIPALEMFGWDGAIELLRDAVDLREVLSALSTPACAALLERLPTSRIVELAGNEAGWFDIDRRLSISKSVVMTNRLMKGDHAT